MDKQLVWGRADGLRLTFDWTATSAPRLVRLESGSVDLRATHEVPFLEVATAAAGHAPASSRLTHTVVGSALRYVAHREHQRDGADELEILTRADSLGLEVLAVLRTVPGVAAVTSETVVRAVGDGTHVLRSVASWSMSLGTSSSVGGESTESTEGAASTATVTTDEVDPKAALARWSLLRGDSVWLGEGRWTLDPLRGAGLPRIREELTGHDARGALSVSSTGTWSTGGPLPVAALVAPDATLLWQVEHNGSWRWEVGEDVGGGTLTLSGPTDLDHGWAKVLAAGDEFRSVPVTVALGGDLEQASAAMTRNRRARRSPHVDDTRMSVVFNDYMNTLDGDPTTDKLLPLVDAAAAAGAEIFCIDAGWYDDTGVAGAWWGSVGEWLPSGRRFPRGLSEVIDRIRSHGMVPGLWLEPEVVGVRSPMVDRLPDDAFLQRLGQRIEEHERYHLDLRHPAVVAHLDATVDRLVEEFHVGFFKLDYNIDAGPGTDVDSDSVGDGLLEHNRAHLAWLDGLRERHPDLVIENCSSGAMRMDFAMMSRLQMQSTSDQQDFRLYPPIAAAAPLVLLPEQAASWAYPQPEMDDEQIAFCLVTGLLGRFYLSGYLNTMTPPQLALVHEAVRAAKDLRHDLVTATPSWPLGLPGWTDGVVALALALEPDDPSTLVSLWVREDTPEVVLPFPALRGRQVRAEVVFPVHLPPWPTSWDPGRAELTVRPTGPAPTARTFRLVPVDS